MHLNQPSGRETGDFANSKLAEGGMYSARNLVNNSFSTL